MENLLENIRKWLPTTRIFLIVYSILLILSGTAYLIEQYFIYGEILDAFFVGLLFGGSFVLILGMKWIKQYFLDDLISFYELLNSHKDFSASQFKKYLNRIFSAPLGIVFGVFYGILVGGITIYYQLWKDYLLFQYTLFLFLFTVNFLTGYALFSLVRVYQFLYRTSKSLELRLYDVKPLTEFITTLSKRASIIAAIYVAFAITSIYFSIIPIDVLTISYSIFAALVILCAYIIPFIPISFKIGVVKKNILKDISFSLQEELEVLLHESGTSNSMDLDRYNNLIELRNRISKIQTIPIGFKAIWNGLYIVLITLLPVALQFILEKTV